jgi:hypothetical protein
MLMFDLLVLAWRADITRISTFMVSRELSNRVYARSGVTEGFHNASHHSEVPANIDRLAKLNEYHTRAGVAYFLRKLAETKDGDGSLLDHAIVVYGSGMANPNQHDHDPLPILLAGGGAGRLQGGRHLRAPEGTPFANLLVSVLGKPTCRPIRSATAPARSRSRGADACRRVRHRSRSARCNGARRARARGVGAADRERRAFRHAPARAAANPPYPRHPSSTRQRRHWRPPLLAAIGRMRELLDSGTKDVDAPDRDGTPALHWVARLGDADLLARLLAAGAKVDGADRHGVTPLQVAIGEGNAA